MEEGQEESAPMNERMNGAQANQAQMMVAPSEGYEKARARAGCYFICLTVLWCLYVAAVLYEHFTQGSTSSSAVGSLQLIIQFLNFVFTVLTLILGLYATKSSSFLSKPPCSARRVWWAIVILLILTLLLDILELIVKLKDFGLSSMVLGGILGLIIIAIFYIILIGVCWSVLAELRKLCNEGTRMEEGGAGMAQAPEPSRTKTQEMDM